MDQDSIDRILTYITRHFFEVLLWAIIGGTVAGLIFGLIILVGLASFAR